jgi:hypothetical protein
MAGPEAPAETVIRRRMPTGLVVGLAVGLAFALTYGTAQAGWLPRGTASWPAVLATALGALLAHEGIHALIARCAGARPRFRVHWFGVCTTFDEPLPRDRYRWTVLAPLVVLDGLALVGLAATPEIRSYAYLVLLVNTTGSTGDIWSAAALRRIPVDAAVRDTGTGFEAHTPGGGPR